MNSVIKYVSITSKALNLIPSTQKKERFVCFLNGLGSSVVVKELALQTRRPEFSHLCKLSGYKLVDQQLWNRSVSINKQTNVLKRKI